jgi:hypothetical protein
MYALIALVVLTAQPDKPLLLESQTRYPTARECEAKKEGTKEALESYFAKMGGATVQLKCVPTSQQDI